MNAIFYLLAVFFGVSQSAAVKYYRKRSEDVLFFNAVKSLAAFLLFVVFAVPNFHFHVPTAAYGMLYGAFLALSMQAGCRALCLGPMSLTGMLVSFSVILPLLYGVIFAGETPTAFQYCGFVFFALSVVLTNLGSEIRTSSIEKSENRGKWLFYVLLTFVSNGFCSVVQKIHQSAYPGLYLGEFVLYASGFCTILFGTAYLAKRLKEGGRKHSGIGFAGFAGISNAAANFCTLFLSGSEYASVMYPVISAGSVLAALVCGRVLFSEKLSRGQCAALVCGLMAVVLLRL